MQPLKSGILVCLSILLFASLPVRAACNTQFVWFPVWTCIAIPVFDWFSGLWGFTTVCFIIWVGTFLDPCPPCSINNPSCSNSPEPTAP